MKTITVFCIVSFFVPTYGMDSLIKKTERLTKEHNSVSRDLVEQHLKHLEACKKKSKASGRREYFYAEQQQKLNELTRKTTALFNIAEKNDATKKMLTHFSIKRLRKVVQNGTLHPFYIHDNGDTLLHYIARDIKATPEKLYILDELPHDINSQNKLGLTPLHESVKTGNKNAAIYFIEHYNTTFVLPNVAGQDLQKPINLNLQDIHGNTPFHYALEASDTAISELLLLRGAQPSLKNLEGDTAFDLWFKQFKQQNQWNDTDLQTLLMCIQHRCPLESMAQDPLAQLLLRALEPLAQDREAHAQEITTKFQCIKSIHEKNKGLRSKLKKSAGPSSDVE
jgi:hypothetical protein